MSIRIHATFDGQVLRPEHPVDLQPGKTYLVTIEGVAHQPHADGDVYPLTSIRNLATDMGVDDLSTNHDRYARCTDTD